MINDDISESVFVMGIKRCISSCILHLSMHKLQYTHLVVMT